VPGVVARPRTAATVTPWAGQDTRGASASITARTAPRSSAATAPATARVEAATPAATPPAAAPGTLRRPDVNHDQHPARAAFVEIFFHLNPLDQGGLGDPSRPCHRLPERTPFPDL